MSLVKKPEMTEANLAAHRANGSKSQGAVTPEGKARVAAANLRHGFYSQARDYALEALGEDPQEYRDMMESLVEDLEPRKGLESQLVLRMGGTLWQMQRAERMREGVAIKLIQQQTQIQERVAQDRFMQVADKVEPFQCMKKALARRDDGPTRAEIQSFVKSCGGSESTEVQEIILLLKSLNEPLEEQERKAVRRKARSLLKKLMDAFDDPLYRLSRQIDKVRSPENLAAIIAPKDATALLMQRSEESNLRQLSRLTNTLIKIRSGALHQKDVKNEDCSGDVYENKETEDKFTVNQNDCLSENA
jgi:hypothetical protein